MSTGIQWCDETWNPTVGCDQVSPGCARCYAKTLHDQRHKAYGEGKLQFAPQYAVPFETVQLLPERLRVPLSWGKPRRVFVNSVSDLFHDDVPDRYIDRVFAIMAQAQRHTFQILTKRPLRMLDYSLARLVGLPLPNVWLGVSVENQRFADERIPLLLQTPAAVRFLSCEPLLGPVDLTKIKKALPGGEKVCWVNALEAREANPAHEYLVARLGADYPCARIDWVIVGGESGKGARPFDVQWARDIVLDCRAAGVASFVKQLGAHPVVANDSNAQAWPYGSIPFADEYEPHHQGEVGPLKLRDSHGGDPEEWPHELRIREFPASGVRT